MKPCAALATGSAHHHEKIVDRRRLASIAIVVGEPVVDPRRTVACGSCPDGHVSRTCQPPLRSRTRCPLESAHRGIRSAARRFRATRLAVERPALRETVFRALLAGRCGWFRRKAGRPALAIPVGQRADSPGRHPCRWRTACAFGEWAGWRRTADARADDQRGGAEAGTFPAHRCR